MIKEKTLLIIGAGASVPYGYPSGAELRNKLINPAAINGLLKKYGTPRDSENINRFCDEFKSSQLESIDAFLANRGNEVIFTPGHYQHDEDHTYGAIGKLAIAANLIDIEIENKDLPEPKYKNNRDETPDHWFKYLWNRMASGVPKDEFKDNQLKIVTFNYDRLLECYFQKSLMSTYNFSHKDSLDLLKNLEILHVYGSLQSLEERTYGSKPLDLKVVANCIKIISEDRNRDSAEFEQAKEFIKWADRIYFIGFGFDEVNTQRLGFPNNEVLSKNIWLTQFGMTEAFAKHYVRSLHGGSSPNYLDRSIPKKEFTELKTLAYLKAVGAFLPDESLNHNRNPFEGFIQQNCGLYQHILALPDFAG